ncbi:MAG: FAD-dependent monooxygenase [Burkholderiales bacterium]
MNKSSSSQGSGYPLPEYPFNLPPELSGGAKRRYAVVVVGGGLAGLAAACDLSVRGVDVVLLDEDNTIGVRGLASRGITYAQKSLEIFDRLGIYDRVKAKGVEWSHGKTLADRDVVYSFDLATNRVSKQPPFINIQQFYIEWFLVDRIYELGGADLRWNNKVIGVEQLKDCVRLQVETPAGNYAIEADWVLDASGVYSPIREAFKLDTHPARGQDRWCISDIRFKLDAPLERWTWVEAPFNENRAVWQLPMGDGVWRLDYQMDANADPDAVSTEAVVRSRLRQQLGEDREFELVWVGPYAYRTQMLDKMRHGRVFFLGDAAHVMSPFGGRGGNSGIQDAENLAWKLALVLNRNAPESLLDSYSAERHPAAVHNIKTTSRTTRFLSPESAAERILRNAVISLAREHAFARPLVNTGRMSTAFSYTDSPLTTHGGAAVQNVPLILADGKPGTLLDLFQGETRFLGLWFSGTGLTAKEAKTIAALQSAEPLLRVVVYSPAGSGTEQLADHGGKLRIALAVNGDCFCLIRPDLHLAAQLAKPTLAAIRTALRRVLAVTQRQ